MNLVWTWAGIPGTFAFIAAWSCAIVALRIAPGRPLNRMLGLILVLEGLFAGGMMGLLFLFEEPSIVVALVTIGSAAAAALPFQYLSFLAIALDSPLVKPFRSRIAMILLGFLSFFAVTLVFVFPERFFSELYRPGWAPWNSLLIDLGALNLQMLGIVYLFALLIALTAFFTARKGSMARSRAMWFAIAFGVRDAYVGLITVLYPILRPIPVWGDFIYNQSTAIAYSVYVLLLAYAVLRSQLFDIDLKVKFVLRHSTVVALIAGIFIISSELLETLIPVSSTALGIMVAVAILIVLRPLHRLALKMSDRLMKNVQDTPEYLDARRLDVYRATLEGVVKDGNVSDKERKVLDHLRENLGISESDAQALEKALT